MYNGTHEKSHKTVNVFFIQVLKYIIWYVYIQTVFHDFKHTLRKYTNKSFPTYLLCINRRKKNDEKIKRMKQIFIFSLEIFSSFSFFSLVTKYIIPISINNHKFNLIYFELCYSNPKCYCAFGI